MLHGTRRKAAQAFSIKNLVVFPPLCTRCLFVINTLTVFLSFCYSECKLFAVFINKDFVRQLKAFLPSLCHLYVPVKCPRGGGI